MVLDLEPQHLALKLEAFGVSGLGKFLYFTLTNIFLRIFYPA
jgi:hypothetical protein